MAFAQFIVPALILLLPAYQMRGSFAGIPVTLLELAILATVIYYLRLRYFFTLEQKNLRWAIAAFVAAGTISAVLSPATIAAAGIWKAYIIEPVFVLYIVRWSIHVGAFSWRYFTRAVSLLLIAIGAVSIAQWFHLLPILSALWSASETFRATSVFPYPNAVALLVGPLLPIALSDRSIISLVGFFFGAIALYLSSSTAGMFAIGIGIMVFIALSGRHSELDSESQNDVIARFRAKTGMTEIIAITLIVVAVLSTQLLQPKLLFQTHSGLLRRQQYTETIQLLYNHPLMGGGFANYQHAILPYHNTSTSGEPFLYPHNFFLAVWTELGLLGLIAIVWILVLVARSLWQQHRRYSSAITASLIAAWVVFLAHGLVDVPYFKNDLSVLFWILVAISTVESPATA